MIDERADEAYDAAVVRYLDDEIEARAEDAERTRDEMSLIDAGNEGRKAGMMGHGASMNPYTDPNSPEFQEWDRQRLATIGARLSQPQRKWKTA